MAKRRLLKFFVILFALFITVGVLGAFTGGFLLMRGPSVPEHATLREVVLRGVLDLAWEQVVAASVLLLALGGLLRFAGLRLGHSSRAQ